MSISIHKNAITEELAKICLNEIEDNYTKNVWKSSLFDWGKNVQKNITGPCCRCKIHENTMDLIYDQIHRYIPKKFDSIDLQYCVWQGNSGLSLHNDDPYYFGATIYLNEFWHPNWGGLFLWNAGERQTENYINQWNVVIPEYRAMVVNSSCRDHLVTHVSPTSPEFRLTIQIFSKTDD